MFGSYDLALAYKIISYLVLMLFSRYLGASALEKVVFFYFFIKIQINNLKYSYLSVNYISYLIQMLWIIFFVRFGGFFAVKERYNTEL